jgi:outer membrane protein OmpA-like peptidoglycan-associated protein
VRDSVSADGDSTLDSASVGEYLVWVLQGPRANLAAFLRGVPPPVLRNELRRRLELIHADLGDPQQALQADAPHVAQALQQTLRLDAIEASLRAETAPPSRGKSRRWPLLLALLAAWAALGWWGWREWEWNQHIEQVDRVLRAWPGLHVEAIEHERGARLRVRALIDADAQPPREALAQLLPPGVAVELDLRGYVSADDAVVLKRARRQLQPPETVRFKVQAGQLHLLGDAPADWVEQARRQAGWVAGVQRVDSSGLRVQDDAQAPLRAEWDRLLDGLPAQRVHFVRELDLRDPEELRTLLATAMRLRELSQALQRPLRLLCRGHNDELGSNATNLDLRERRARWLCTELAAAGFAAADLRAAPGQLDPNLTTIDARAASLRRDTSAAEDE